MPRKDNVKKNGSKNERSQDQRGISAPTQSSSYTYNDIADAMNPIMERAGPGGFILSNMDGVHNYSDFVRNANVSTNGWYSTLANGLPFVKDLHNAVLGRDSAEDYLKNNNLTWGDMEGYNDIKLLGRSLASVEYHPFVDTFAFLTKSE